jgi:multiple sugar transport system substrate-binding protein
MPKLTLNFMEEKMKRVIAIVIVTLLFSALFFAGCGGSGGGSKDVTLRVGMWDQNQAPGIEKVLADFTAETGIKTQVEVTPWNDYWTLLEAAATGGSLPDVFWMHSGQVRRYMEANLLIDLTDRINSSSLANMSNFPQDLVDLYALNGKQYAIPKDLDTIGLVYNKKLFDEAGVAYPTNNWTWDDLRDAARRLSNPSKEQWGIAFTPGETQTGYWNLIYQNGGYVINAPAKKSGFDDPKTIEAMQFVESLLKDGYAVPLSYLEGDLMALMQGNVCAMATFGSWMLSAFNSTQFFVQNCDIAMLPAGPGGKRATIYNGLGWAATTTTKVPEEAWKLLEFLSTESAQRKLAENGVAISCFKGTAAPFVNGFPQFNVAAYIDQIQYAVMRPFSKNTGLWEDMSVRIFNEVWAGTKSAADGCREIAQSMNAMLAAE